MDKVRNQTEVNLSASVTRSVGGFVGYGYERKHIWICSWASSPPKSCTDGEMFSRSHPSKKLLAVAEVGDPFFFWGVTTGGFPMLPWMVSHPYIYGQG